MKSSLYHGSRKYVNQQKIKNKNKGYQLINYWPKNTILWLVFCFASSTFIGLLLLLILVFGAALILHPLRMELSYIQGWDMIIQYIKYRAGSSQFGSLDKNWFFFSFLFWWIFFLVITYSKYYCSSQHIKRF